MQRSIGLRKEIVLRILTQAQPAILWPSRYLRSRLSKHTRLPHRPIRSSATSSRPSRPYGKTVAFVRFLRPRVGDVYVIPSAGGEARRLTFDNKDIQGLTWTPDGHSIVVGTTRGGPIGLWRISDIGGEPEPVGVAGEQALLPTLSRQDQRLAYTTSSEASSMWRVDLSPASRRGGRPVSLSRTAAWEGLPEMSSDARRITFSSSRSGAP